MQAMKADAATLRLCHAVGLATRVRVGRWAAISEIIEILPVIDQVQDETLLAAAVASGLITINSGPIAHSIAFTAAGLDLCRSMAEPEWKRRPLRPRPERPSREETPEQVGYNACNLQQSPRQLRILVW
jgi:hypothetical protein